MAELQLLTKTSKVTKTSQVQDENVPDSEQQVPKCPTFRVRLVKHKDENVPDSARTKTSHIPREVRKRPRFCNWQGTKTSQIPFSTWKRKCPNFRDEKVPFSNHDATTIILVFMRSSAIFGKICGENKNMRNYAENIELCGIVRRTGNCAKSHSPHLNVASDIWRVLLCAILVEPVPTAGTSLSQLKFKTYTPA